MPIYPNIIPHIHLHIFTYKKQFVTLYKSLFPDINVALEEEEVEVNEWAVSDMRDMDLV
jgi:hypothetical protein